MDYREELLNKTMMRLNEAGVADLDRIRQILILSIGAYEISEKCTELAVVDNSDPEIVKMFLATKRIEGGSARTARTRWWIIQKFCRDINKPLREICTFDVLRWIANEQQRVSLSSAESYRTILASLFSWMAQSGLIKHSPMETIKPIKHPEVIKKSLNTVEVDALKSACKTKLDRAMLELLLSSGLRCEELCNLKWDDIDWTTKDIRVIEGKGGKNRVTMMDDVTKKYLLEYKLSLGYESEYVFAVKYRGEIKCRTTDSVWRKLKALADRAGVDGVSPHTFRHTFATVLYKRGLDVRMIQKLLGHSNINTTMIYIDSNLEMLRDAYKRCV